MRDILPIPWYIMFYRIIWKNGNNVPFHGLNGVFGKMSWLGLLIFIHVLSAIIGVGPTFFTHVLLRKNQSVMELRTSIDVAHRLGIFPKIGGTLAVITGLILVAIGDMSLDYTKFFLVALANWALILFIYIEILVIGSFAPIAKKLAGWLNVLENTIVE